MIDISNVVHMLSYHKFVNFCEMFNCFINPSDWKTTIIDNNNNNNQKHIFREFVAKFLNQWQPNTGTNDYNWFKYIYMKKKVLLTIALVKLWIIIGIC